LAGPRSIVDIQQVERLLAALPRERTTHIQLRVALRVLPLIFQAIDASEGLFGFTNGRQIVLSAFRMALIGWAKQAAPNSKVGSDPTHRAIVAARAVTVGFPSSLALSKQISAAMAAMIGGMADYSGVSSLNMHVVSSAAEAASLASVYGARDFMGSLLADAQWLSDNGGHLIDQPLWLNEVRHEEDFLENIPVWVLRPLDAFTRNVLVSNGSWGVWTDWYRSLLADTASSPNILWRNAAADLALQDDSFWSRDPDLVTDEVAGFFGVRSKATLPQTGGRGPQTDLTRARRLLLALILARAQERHSADSVEPQSDEPTADDQLGRRPFAQALVERMDRIYEKGGHDGFAAHIYAPWGAGKTSVLMMMRDLLIAKDRKSTDGRAAPHWVVVRFNAWEQERRNPPWWPLVEAVKGECLSRLSGASGGWKFACFFLKEWWLKGYQVELQPLLLQFGWIWWKLRTDALPYVVFLAVFAAACSILWAAGTNSSAYEFVLKVFAAAVAAVASFLGASRIAIFGSSSNAKFYDDISQDPLRRITHLFRKIVEKTNAPVCIFIDDLDRCRSDYVVDLLEGIQTSFRHRNVAYVVAADRAWIKASFEARYGSFSNAVSNLGQPLGYLFLEKVFQVSTPVPGMGNDIRSAYWNRLLRGTLVENRTEPQGSDSSPSVSSTTTMTREFDKAVEAKREELRQEHGDSLTREQAENILKRNNTAEDRAAIVLELNASRAAEKEAEHLLVQFVDVLPDNPRVMKRMLNAFAMRQAIGLLERSETAPGILARWTILEQRFPSLADLLIVHPEWIKFLAGKVEGADPKDDVPAELVPFATSVVVQSIVGIAENQRLTSQEVLAITRGSKT